MLQSQNRRGQRRPRGTYSIGHCAAVVCAAALASSLAAATPADAATATTRAAAPTAAVAQHVEGSHRAAVPQSVSNAVTRARRALDRAVTSLDAGRYHDARDFLNALATRIGLATHAAKNQIGKPPADPESDEPPGPPSVLAVLRLDHSVVMTLVPYFNGMRRVGVVDGLSTALRAAVHRRDNLVNAVLALKPGQRGDYADGMADTLPTYRQELRLLTDAQTTYTLTDESRTALANAEQQVRETKAKMDAAFGGGE